MLLYTAGRLGAGGACAAAPVAARASAQPRKGASAAAGRPGPPRLGQGAAGGVPPAPPQPSTSGPDHRLTARSRRRRPGRELPPASEADCPAASLDEEHVTPL